MHRLNDHTAGAAARRGLRKTPIEYLKDNLLATTSGNWYEPAFVCTLLALGADRILFTVALLRQLRSQLQHMLLGRIVMETWKDHLEVGLKMPVECLIPRTREAERPN